ncbi:MAG TPA: deoxyribonuclease IV [Gaiellaceae bacterium]|nr:deoxyribonuclease IV [Gaiellaceae bacterium]
MLFGAHVSAAGGISKAIDRIEEIGGNAVQVFTQSPRMWKPTAHSDDEIERFRTRRRQARVKSVTCHALYLVNLASKDREIRAKSLASLEATMETAQAIGAEAVVFHVGSHLGYGFADAVKVVTRQLRRLLELTTDDLWLCLENSAGAGGTIGRSIDELAVLCDALGGHPRLGVCIDSCHWWASGVDVSDPVALDEAVADLDARLGLERLRCLHVNDAAVPLGANRDRHEVVAEGAIGAGLATFLGHPAFRGLPAVLETWPKGGLTRADIDGLRRLHQRGRRRRARAS